MCDCFQYCAGKKLARFWELLKISFLTFSLMKRKQLFLIGPQDNRRKLESIHEYHSVERKNEGRKPDRNSSLRRLEIKPRNLV
jgi:hypothetical protein